MPVKSLRNSSCLAHIQLVAQADLKLLGACSDVQKVVEGKPHQLIETVAHEAACAVLRRHPLVQTAIIRVDKPHAPIEGDFGTVGELGCSENDLLRSFLAKPRRN